MAKREAIASGLVEVGALLVDYGIIKSKGGHCMANNLSQMMLSEIFSINRETTHFKKYSVPNSGQHNCLGNYWHFRIITTAFFVLEEIYKKFRLCWAIRAAGCQWCVSVIGVGWYVLLSWLLCWRAALLRVVVWFVGWWKGKSGRGGKGEKSGGVDCSLSSAATDILSLYYISVRWELQMAE